MITKMINFELLANTAQYYKVKFFKINLYLRLSLSLSLSWDDTRQMTKSLQEKKAA